MREEGFRAPPPPPVGAGEFRSFFLCERLLALLTFGVAVPEAWRMAGVGAMVWAEVGMAEEGTAKCSKSFRWFANVFCDVRILRTAGVTLPWLTVKSTIHVSYQSPHIKKTV